MADTGAGSDTKLEKAYLTIQPVTATGQNAGAATTLALLFNPTEYRVAKSAQWMRTAAQAAKQTGPIQWRGAGPARLTVTLFLDESDSTSGSVRTDAETLLGCCAPTPESLQRNEPCAPYVRFCWGSTTGFTAVMHEVDVTYTLFRNDGQPCRATVTLTMEEVDTPPVRQNPTSGSDTVSRTHTVTAGDRLPLVAYRMYGDATLWRLIAEANRIEDPLVLRSGDALLIPARPAEEAP